MLGRLRSALLPRNPIYRRESGAGQRTVTVTKITAAVMIMAAYGFWMFMAYSRRDHGQIPVTVTAIASCLFCLIFFALGVQSVRGEVADGTAEALIMTPLSRYRLILSKLAGSVELLIVAALLLPFYCFTLAPSIHGDRVMAFMHGALLRLALTPDSWIPGGDQPFAIEALIGLAAFVGDLAWYAFFSSCGIWAACTTSSALRSWLKGLAVSGGLLGVLTVFEWLLGDPGNPYWLLSAITRGNWYQLAYVFDFGWRDRSAQWMAIWFLVVVLTRLLLSALFIHRAARSFDTIATD
jgi:hypothetical protein